MSIISRLNARFAGATTADSPDMQTRDIGGHFRNNQPYISGYFQIIFGLPDALFRGQAAGAAKWLHSTCEGFTPHTQNINKVDIQGQGQIGSSFAASVTTTREFTTTFREYQQMPILNVIRTWASVFDPFTGVSPLGGTSSKFIPQNYKGWAAVIQTKPVKSGENQKLVEADIEECYIYQGVFPTTIPVDTASASDITGNDTVQLSATWSFDGAPLTSAEDGVMSKCISLLDNQLGSDAFAATNGAYGTFEKYLQAGTTVGNPSKG